MLQDERGRGLRFGGRERQRDSALVDLLQQCRDAGVNRRIEDTGLQILGTVDIERFLGLCVSHPAALAERVENRRPDIGYELGGARHGAAQLLERVGEGRGDPRGRVDDRAIEVEQYCCVLGH